MKVIKNKKIALILLLLILSFSVVSCKDNKSSSLDPDKSPKNIIQKSSEQEKNDITQIQDKDAIITNILEDSTQNLVYDFYSEESEAIKNYKTKDYSNEQKEIENIVIIRIPQVNFKTEDAKLFNRQMQEFAKEEYLRYEWNTKHKMEWPYDTDYRFFKNEDVLSIILFQQYAREKNLNKSFSKYDFLNIKSINFNIKTGEILSDTQLLDIFHIQNYEEKILSAIYSFGKGFRKRILESTPPTEREQINSILSCSIATSNTTFWRALYHLENRPNTFYNPNDYKDPNKKYWLLDDMEHINKLPQLFYSEEEDSLFACIKLGTPAGAGFYYQSFDIGKLEIKHVQLNPAYEYYAGKLGIDPNAEDSPMLFSAFLGYLNDKKCSYRLQSIKDCSNLDLENLLSVKMDDYQQGTVMFGDELFVLIPKYEDTSLCFSHISLNEKNEENVNSFITLSGNVFLQANPSDLYSNCEIQVNFRDKLIKYRPYINQIDGSNGVEEGIVDISPLIERELSKKANDAKKYLEKFLPKG